MDYATTTQSYLGGTAAEGERPYLTRIADAADELERVAGYIDSFIARCRGGSEGAKVSGPTPVPSGHFGQLERLSENVGRVDKLARELQSIG